MRPPPISTLFPTAPLFLSQRRGSRPGCRGPSAAHPVAQVQHPLAPDDHVGVLQQVLAVHRPEVPLAGAEHHREIGKSTRLNSSHANISYAVFCLKKKTKKY